MKKAEDRTYLSTEREGAGGPAGKTPGRETSKSPFVEPTLVKHGELEKITAGFFGTFSP